MCIECGDRSLCPGRLGLRDVYKDAEGHPLGAGTGFLHM